MNINQSFAKTNKIYLMQGISCDFKRKAIHQDNSMKGAGRYFHFEQSSRNTVCKMRNTLQFDSFSLPLKTLYNSIIQSVALPFNKEILEKNVYSSTVGQSVLYIRSNWFRVLFKLSISLSILSAGVRATT